MEEIIYENEIVDGDSALIVHELTKDYCPIFYKLLALTKIVKFVEVAKMRGRRALDTLNLNLARGEIYGLVGQNGAGKSTTLKMVAGITTPTKGEITICGIDLKKDRLNALMKIGAIVETPQFYTHLSGYDNLKYLASLSNITDNEIILKTLKGVGLEDRASDKVGIYSLGMKQRLGLAQALVHRPSLLILDEPTNGLDPSGIAEIRALLKKIARDFKVTILISSHILPEMQLLCDRIGILDKGVLVKEFAVSDTLCDSSSIILELSVDNVELAEAVLKSEFPAIEFTITDKKFSVKASETIIPDITRAMVLGGVNIKSVGMKERTLEDIYFGATTTTKSSPFAEFDDNNMGDNQLGVKGDE